MKILIAPDSFKESMTATEAATAIKEGFQRVFPKAEYIMIPMADGGEGTVQSLVDATHGKMIEVNVTGPLGIPVDASFGLHSNGKTAFIEMASASGLQLVPPDKRNPMVTTTYGTGELIKSALDRGVRHLIIGIGGSATNDGGAGMLQALGVHLLDSMGKEIPPGAAGLEKLHTIQTSNMDPRLEHTIIDVACDVDNPLTGPKGASVVYGPQKGATPQQVEKMDGLLGKLAMIIERDTGKKVKDEPGAGAAGGLGAAIMAFLGGNLQKGGNLVIEATQLEEMMQGADLVITGEGSIDPQSIHGKTPICVAKVARKYNIPVIAFTGSLSPDHQIVMQDGLQAIFTIVPGAVSLENALMHAYENLRISAYQVASFLRVARNIKPEQID